MARSGMGRAMLLWRVMVAAGGRRRAAGVRDLTDAAGGGGADDGGGGDAPPGFAVGAAAIAPRVCGRGGGRRREIRFSGDVDVQRAAIWEPRPRTRTYYQQHHGIPTSPPGGARKETPMRTLF